MLRYLFSAIAVLLLFSSLTAQNSYKTGYIIDQQGRRTEVEIYDKDWVSNPEHFRYRTVDGETQQGDPRTIREFGYQDGSLRYRLFTVDIDQSSTRVTTMSTLPTPEYRAMTVYLEWLVDGEADLFFWKNGNTERLFLRLGEESPDQLVSRSYLKEGGVIDNTNQYRAELLKALDCGVSRSDVLASSYTRESLADIVHQYNACIGVPTEQQMVRTPRPDRFSLALRLGAEQFWGMIHSDRTNGLGGDYTLDRTVSPRIGVEAQALLPFGNNRWALYTEAYYHSFNNRAAGPETAIIDYQSVNVAGGARRYIYLSQSTALFVNAALVLQFPISSSVQFPQRDTDQRKEVPAFRNAPLQAGIGISISDRYQMEFQINETQNVIGHLDSYTSYYTNIKSLGLVLSYRFP